jgi:hypothetical protein
MCECGLKIVPLLSGMLLAVSSSRNTSSPCWAPSLIHLHSALKTPQGIFLCISVVLISTQPREHFLFLMLHFFVGQKQICPGSLAMPTSGINVSHTALPQ